MPPHGLVNQQPRIIPRNEHHISRKSIDPDALKILYRLKDQGFDAYLVGGGIRDLLLGQTPKDFDIVTNATPEELKKTFKNCRIIGRRFRLAHFYFPGKIIEVATFRGHHTEEHEEHVSQHRNGMIVRDNVYGTIEEDVWRRDFTLNALYYNIKDFSLVDFVDAIEDVAKRRIRIIGDPVERYTEDPVRMIRAVRFAAKLNCKIEAKTAKPISEMASLIQHVSPSRLFDEVVKLFHYGHALASFELLQKYEIFAVLFPELSSMLNKKYETMLGIALKNTDERINQGKTLSVVFLFSMLLWPAVECHYDRLVSEGMTPYLAMLTAGKEVVRNQNKTVAISKRLLVDIAEIWLLQYRMLQLDKRSIHKVLHSKRFRAGYDLLTLRAEIDKKAKPSADWWTAYQVASEKQREGLLASLKPVKRKRKKKAE